MPLPRQIKKIKYEFYSASAASVISSGAISLNDYEVSIQHENPLGNPTFSKSLNGYLVPYGVKGRMRFKLDFSKMVGGDITTTTTFFDKCIQYHNASDASIRFYPKYESGDGTISSGATDYVTVVLEAPVELIQRYKSQIGSYVPTVTLIGQELITAVPTGFSGV
jgi:hypothetical protein